MLRDTTSSQEDSKGRTSSVGKASAITLHKRKLVAILSEFISTSGQLLHWLKPQISNGTRIAKCDVILLGAFPMGQQTPRGERG